MKSIDLATVADALNHIPSTSDRGHWVKMGAAIKSEFPGDDGLALFHSWSASSPSQYNKRGTDSTWRSLKPQGGVTIASLIKEAKDNGWTPEKTTRKPRLQQASSVPVSQPRNQQEDSSKSAAQAADDAAAEAVRLISTSKPGAPSAYLARKGVAHHGTYTTPSGVLLVPMVNHDGEVRNVQRILPQKPQDGPDKLYLKGGQKSGLFHVIGSPIGSPDDVNAILFAEGYSTAATLNEATGLPVVVTFDGGNLPKVAASWRERYPTAKFVICGDDDHQLQVNAGRDKAIAAATATMAHLAFPTDGYALKGTDFNDLYAETGGSEAVVRAINNALAAPTVAPETSPVAKGDPIAVAASADSTTASSAAQVTATPDSGASATTTQQLQPAASPVVAEVLAKETPFAAPFPAQDGPATSKATAKPAPPTPEQGRAAAQALWSQGTNETASPVVHAHQMTDTYGAATTKNGVLLVPMRDSDGVVQNVQRIMPELSTDGLARAYYVKGASKDGLTHTIGNANNAKEVVVAKDFLGGASIHKATGLAVVVTFTEKGYQSAIEALKAQDPDRQVLLAGIDDKGKQLEHASAIAKSTGARLLLVSDFRPSQFNGATFEQLHLQHGDQAIRDVFRTVPPLREPTAQNTQSQKNTQGEAPSEPEAGQLERDMADFQEPPVAQLVGALDELKAMYDVDAKGGFYFKNTDKKLAFRDSGARLHTPHDDMDTARSMLKLAQSKGWKVVKLDGSEDFIRNAWLEAELLGLKTKGYKPDQYDLDRLNERRAIAAADAKPFVNTIAEVNNPIVASSPNLLATSGGIDANLRQELAVAAPPFVKETRSSPIGPTEKIHQAVLANVQTHLEGHGIVPAEVEKAKAYAGNFLKNSRAYFGKVTDHGAAPYEFDPKKNTNYFVKLETPRGEEKIIWGVDLQRSMTSADGPRVGETIVIAYQGENQVTVTNEDGTRVLTHRNEWFVKNVAKIHYDGNNPAISTLDANPFGRSPDTVTPTVQVDKRDTNLRVLQRALQINDVPPGLANKAISAVAPGGIAPLKITTNQISPASVTRLVTRAPSPSM